MTKMSWEKFKYLENEYKQRQTNRNRETQKERAQTKQIENKSGLTFTEHIGVKT